MRFRCVFSATRFSATGFFATGFLKTRFSATRFSEIGVIQGLFLLTCLALSHPLFAQSSTVAAGNNSQPASSETIARQHKIDAQLAELHRRQKADAPVHELAIRWAFLGAEYGNAGDTAEAEAAYNHAIQLVATEKQETELYSEILDQLGALYRIYGRNADALRCYRKALEVRAPFLDPLEDARSRARVAEIALQSHDYKEAYAETDQAYHSMLRMFDPDSSEVISALIVRAYAQCGLRHMHEAQLDASEALRLSRKEFSEASTQAAASLTALGFAQLKAGNATEAELLLHKAVDLFHAQLSTSDPRLLFAMQQYHQSLVSLHRKEEARRVQNELEAAVHQPQAGCANCDPGAFSVRSVAAQASSSGNPSGGQYTLSSPDAAAAWKPAAPGPPEP